MSEQHEVERKFSEIMESLDQIEREAELDMLRSSQTNLRDMVALTMLQSIFRYDNGAFVSPAEAVEDAFEYADAFMQRRGNGE